MYLAKQNSVASPRAENEGEKPEAERTMSDPGPRDCAHCIDKEDSGYIQGMKNL